MNCQVEINSSGKILRVSNQQGEDSKLYKSLVDSGYSPETALSLWSIAYTDDFKNEYGDFNEEPSIVYLNHVIKKLKLSNTGFSTKEKLDIESIIKAPIKEGVSELFNKNSELSNIGTPEQYSKYIDNIFPNSKVKDIVYHVTNKVARESILKEGFREPIDEELEDMQDSLIWFSKDENYYDKKEDKTIISIPALVNIKFPNINSHENFLAYGDASGIKAYNLSGDGLITQEEDAGDFMIERAAEEYFSEYGKYPDNYSPNTSSNLVFTAVPTAKQIHILGSKQDIEGFKNFVRNISESRASEKKGHLSVYIKNDDGSLTDTGLFLKTKKQRLDDLVNAKDELNEEYNKNIENNKLDGNYKERYLSAIKKIDEAIEEVSKLNDTGLSESISELPISLKYTAENSGKGQRFSKNGINKSYSLKESLGTNNIDENPEIVRVDGTTDKTVFSTSELINSDMTKDLDSRIYLSVMDYFGTRRFINGFKQNITSENNYNKEESASTSIKDLIKEGIFDLIDYYDGKNGKGSAYMSITKFYGQMKGIISISELDKKKSSSLKLISTFSERFLISGYSETNKDFNTLLIQPFNTGKNEFYYISSNEENLENLKTKFPGYLFQKLTKENYLEATKEIKFNPYVTKNSNKIAIPFKENGKWGSPKLENIIDFIDQSKIVLFNDKAVNIGTEDDPKHTNFITPSIIIDQFLESFPQKKETVIPKEEAKIENVEQAIIPEVKKESKARNIARNISMSKSFNDNSIVITITEDDEQIKVKSPEQKNIFVRNISIDIYNKLKSNNEDIYNSIIKYTNELDRSNDVDLSILYQLTNNMKLIGFQETTLIDDFILDLNYIGVKITKKGYYANVLKSKIALSMDENETDEGVDERADGLKEVFYSDDKSVTMDPAKSIREKLKEVILKLKITESEFDFVKNEFSDNFVNVVDTELKSFKHPSGMPKYVMNYTKFLNEVRELAAPIFEKSETAQKEYEAIIKTLKAHSYIAGGQFHEFANILEINKDDLSGAFISYIKTQYTDFVNTKIDTETTEKKKLFSQNDYATKQIIAEDGMLSALFNSNLFKYNEETENYTQDKELIKSILDRKELNKKNAQFDKNEYLKTSSKVFYFFKKDIPLENSDSISREIMAVLNALLDLGLNKKQSIGVLNSYVMQKNNISGLTYLIKETLLRSQLYDYNDKDSFDLLQTKAAEFNQYFVSYDLRRTISLYRNGKSRFKHIRNSFLYGFTRQIYRYEKQIKTIADPKSTLLEVKSARLEIKDPEILNIIKSPSRLKIVIDFINFKIKIDQATPTQYNDEFIEASDLDNKERRIIALNEFISPYSELHGAKSNMQLPQMGENSTIFYFKASQHIQNPNNSYHYDGKNNLLKVDLGDRNKRVLKSIISNEVERIFSNLNKFNEVVSDGRFNENYEGDFKAGKDYIRLENGLISNGVGSYFITFPFLNSSEKMTPFLNNGIISIEKIKSFFKEENEEAAIQKFTDSIGDLIIENVIGQVYELKEKLIDDGLIIKNGNFGVFSKEILPINYDEKYSVKSISKNEKDINRFPEGTDHVLFNFLMNNTFSNSYYMAIFNDPSNAAKAVEKDGKLDIQSSIEVTIDNLLKRNKGSITPGFENISEIKASAIIIKKMVADMQITDNEEFKSILEAKAKEQMFLISGKEKFSEFTFNAPPFGTETTVSEYVFNLYEYNKTNTFDDFYVIMEAALKPIFKTYKDIEVGDGVLYSSIDFHLRLKKDLSYITAMEYKILNLIYNQTDIYEYKNAFDGKYSQIKNKELRNLLEQEYPINKNGLDELRKVLTYGLTPMKPVYSTFDKYFKMAEFPIIPLFHSGTNLGNLHDVMKSTRNDIIMYDSASKLLTEDKYNYKFNGEFLTDFTGAPVSDLAEGIPLNMGYYLNQTETQGQTKTEINNASQFYKVLFSNFSMIENGQSLMDDFLDTHYNLLNALSEEFIKKNKLSNTTGGPKFKNLRQLVNYIKDIIQDPGQEVKVDQQIIDSLQLTNDEEYEKLIEIQNNELKDFDRKLFLLSNDDINAKNELLKELSELKTIHEHQRDQVNTGAKWVNNPYFSFGFKKLESVMLSNYRSAIPDFKLKGTAAIISSEANNTFNPRMIENSGPILSNSVIWVDGRKAGHSLKDDEIIIPFAYVCSNSKERLYIEDYITVDNNGIQTIDQNKLPKELATELLRCIGYRVPIQGQNSTAPLVVAGFLNSSFGATCIANKNLIGRMGSDFDSDKLYILLPNVFTDLSVNRNQLFDDYVNSGFVKSGDNYYFNNELLTSNDLINMIKSFMNLKYQYIDSQEYRDELRSKRNELKKVLPKQNLKYSGSSINLVDRSDESIDGYKQNLFEIQYEILTKKELASAITFPNHYGEILEIAKELDFIKEKPAYNPTGYLFIENQRNEAIAGRDGVGVYSIFVTGLTKAQMMKSSLPKFPVVILNGKQHPLNSLYRSLQIDNKVKTSEALQILQSIMVDNLKLGVSGKVNLNKNTFLVAGFMQQLGIPLRETLYVLNNKQVMDYFSSVSKLVKNGSKMSDAILKVSGIEEKIKEIKKKDSKISYSDARFFALEEAVGSNFNFDKLVANVTDKKEDSYNGLVKLIAGLHFLSNIYYSDINALNTDTDNMTAGSVFEISKVNSDFNKSFNNQFIIHESKYKWGEKDSIFKNYNKFGNENALSLFSETVDGQSISPFANEEFIANLNSFGSQIFNYKTVNSTEKMTQILSEFQYYLINLNVENRPTLYNDLITNRSIQKMDASIKSKNTALKQDPFLSSFSIAGKVITFNNINELDYNYINAYYNTETNPEYKELMEAYFTYFLISGEINKSSDFRKLIPTSFINKITDNKLTDIYNSNLILDYIKSYFLSYAISNPSTLPLLTLQKNDDGEIPVLRDKMYIDEFDYVKPGKEPLISNVIQNRANNVYIYDSVKEVYVKSKPIENIYKSPYLFKYDNFFDFIANNTVTYNDDSLKNIKISGESLKKLDHLTNQNYDIKSFLAENKSGFNLIPDGNKVQQALTVNKVLSTTDKSLEEYLNEFAQIYFENKNKFFIGKSAGKMMVFNDTQLTYDKLVQLMFNRVISDPFRLFIDRDLSKVIRKDKSNLILKELLSINIPTEYEIEDKNKIIVPELNSTFKIEIATPDSGKIINIYYGTNENKELSNFAYRPFDYNGFTYQNVEQAFQHQKLRGYAPHSTAQNYLNDDVDIKILRAKDGAEAKKLGREIKGLNTIAWDKDSSKVMKNLLLESFKQNSNALAELLATGNATLTHTQDKGKWGKEFPKLLMEVRLELNETEEPEMGNAKNEVSEIYSQLGDKTESENIQIKSVYQKAGVKFAESIEGIFSLRVDNSNEHFGNPFSPVESEIEKGLIPVKTTKEAVEKYIEWLLSPTTIIRPEQHKWIREQLISGDLKDSPIIYYKELGEPSHATALDYLINKYDWNSNNNTKEPEIVTISNETINLIEKDLFSKIISKYTYYFKNNNGEFEKLSNENYEIVKNNNETLYKSPTATAKFAEFSYFMEFYLEKVLNQGIKDLNILDHSSVEDFINTNTNDEFFLSDPDYAISYEMQKRNLENFSGIKLDKNDNKKSFKKSLYRGQEFEPDIDKNGNLIISSSYDTLFRSNGVSFAENYEMAEGYGLRYSKNPWVIEIDQEYADKIYPFDPKGGTKSFGKRVIGDFQEQRFVTENAGELIMIPKGSYVIHKKNIEYNFLDKSVKEIFDMLDNYDNEGEFSEFHRSNEGQGFATNEKEYQQALIEELKKRGLSDNEISFYSNNQIQTTKTHMMISLGIENAFENMMSETESLESGNNKLWDDKYYDIYDQKRKDIIEKYSNNKKCP